jgi:hypothetical protein
MSVTWGGTGDQVQKMGKLKWEKDFLLEPVDELGKGLQTGNRGEVKTALENVVKVCFDCHFTSEPKIQFKNSFKRRKS